MPRARRPKRRDTRRRSPRSPLEHPVSPSARRPALSSHRRIVVKVGSSLLVDGATGKLNAGWLASLADDIAALAEKSRDVLVVSSGAIALGRGALGLKNGALKLEDAQAAAAVGQVA